MATARARAVAHWAPGAVRLFHVERLTAFLDRGWPPARLWTERTWLVQTASQGRGSPHALCHTGDCGTGIRTLQKRVSPSFTTVKTKLISERVCIRARATAVGPHCESPLNRAWKVLPNQVQRVATRDAPRRIVWVIECLHDETCNSSDRRWCGRRHRVPCNWHRRLVARRWSIGDERI